ncbi:MAG: hypothetical protein HYV19_02525 [Gemmatimonadetes bacterium]|nr:hypothetical protein [Gemmatimonadota bacterium]
MNPRSAIRVVIALLVFEAVAPALVAHAFVPDPKATVRALALLPLAQAVGLWAGRRLAYVLTRALAGLQIVVAGGIVILALATPSAPFFLLDATHVIPRIAGLTMMGLLVATGWWQWRLLGRREVTALFADVRW